MKNLTTERKMIFDILVEVILNKKQLNETLNTYFGMRNFLEKRSRAFISCVVYGTIENKIYIDYIIEKFSKIKVKKIRPQILIILEMSIYQLLFLEGIKEYAVVDEACKIVKNLGVKGLVPYVNAILRNVKKSEDAKNIDKNLSKEEYISIKYSVPLYLIKMWKKQLGLEKTEEICIAIKMKRNLTIRINTSLITKEELIKTLETEKVEVMTSDFEEVLYLKNIDNLNSLESFKKGLFYVQDLSCILSGKSYANKSFKNILDVCASPGGKSINLSLLLDDENIRITSCDVSEKKVRKIRENIDRLNIKNIYPKVKDARIKDEKEEYDLVIADVPCTGFGIIRRKPDILIHRKEEDIKSIINLQKEIVDSAIYKLKSGGRFVYSTCTINKEENEDMRFYIEENYNLKCEKEELIFPNERGEDGFYTAIFIKYEK